MVNSETEGGEAEASHRLHEAVVAVLLGVEHAVLDEDGDGPQDEGHKQVHVDEVPGAVELPADTQQSHSVTDRTPSLWSQPDSREGSGCMKDWLNS